MLVLSSIHLATVKTKTLSQNYNRNKGKQACNPGLVDQLLSNKIILIIIMGTIDFKILPFDSYFFNSWYVFSMDDV